MLQKHTLSQRHPQNQQQQLSEKHEFSTTKFPGTPTDQIN